MLPEFEVDDSDMARMIAEYSRHLVRLMYCVYDFFVSYFWSSRPAICPGIVRTQLTEFERINVSAEQVRSNLGSRVQAPAAKWHLEVYVVHISQSLGKNESLLS